MVNRHDIPYGRECAITREELARRWRCTERDVRGHVANLRLEHCEDAILSTSHTPPGYWRSSEPTEIAAFIRETESRAKNTFRALTGARYVLKGEAHKR